MAKKNSFSSTATSDKIFYVLVYGIAIFAFLITLYPFIYIIATSFSGAQAVYQGRVTLFPIDFNIAGYKQVFKQDGLWQAYGNTIFYT
ncbi:MAG: carbohydrate ABC transporter permease, partial [Firmicutes bacterium]|nr:carbohydrate ABC transporter permease [Bacillota bacterium]